uniref:Uncharacterized protein n=1 Tax=Knipowitschia caucasica TaxID=637954 RepID=A0AAV2LD55_KNICA
MTWQPTTLQGHLYPSNTPRTLGSPQPVLSPVWLRQRWVLPAPGVPSFPVATHDYSQKASTYSYPSQTRPSPSHCAPQAGCPQRRTPNLTQHQQHQLST